MDANGRCPRCEGAFSCAAEAGLEGPCACFGVMLSDAARHALRARYTRCVCVACLREVQAECQPDDRADAQAPRLQPPHPAGT